VVSTITRIKSGLVCCCLDFQGQGLVAPHSERLLTKPTAPFLGTDIEPIRHLHICRKPKISISSLGQYHSLSFSFNRMLRSYMYLLCWQVSSGRKSSRLALLRVKSHSFLSCCLSLSFLFKFASFQYNNGYHSRFQSWSINPLPHQE